MFYEKNRQNSSKPQCILNKAKWQKSLQFSEFQRAKGAKCWNLDCYSNFSEKKEYSKWMTYICICQLIFTIINLVYAQIIIEVH